VSLVAGRTFRGVPASEGVAAGVVRVLGRALPAQAATEMDVDGALDAAARELQFTSDRLRAAGHEAEAEIVSVGVLIAEDPVLRDDARERVAAGHDPAQAITTATERHAVAMEALRDPMLRERAADIRQVGRRAVAVLRGAPEPTPDEGVVLVANELGPAEVMGLGGGGVVAGVAVRGGANSHAAIVARTLGLPLVLGVDADVLEAEDGVPIVVDADAGEVSIEPPEADVSRARAAMDAAARRREALAAERGLPAETLDGRRVTLLCNVATEAETRMGLEAGAEGVGLLRTELTFLEADDWPDEDAHRRVLDPILDLLEGKRAIVRVLDFGGDKVPPFLARDLPFTAAHVRGLPALLRAKDALASQVRAALRSGRETLLGILVPMVTSIREVRLAREIVEGAVKETGAGMPEVGVMVEVPSAALLADRLAAELDFLAIGTNDLTEHALGISRRDPASRPALGAHPSVLTLINRVARAGQENGCAVRVCGEAAADPLVLPLLVGLGIETLSMSPSKVDEVRARVRRLSAKECAATARAALAADSVEEVWELVRERNAPDLP
jgi:phosphoenolpyruvate-protein phosphotransferase